MLVGEPKAPPPVCLCTVGHGCFPATTATCAVAAQTCGPQSSKYLLSGPLQRAVPACALSQSQQVNSLLPGVTSQGDPVIKRQNRRLARCFQASSAPTAGRNAHGKVFSVPEVTYTRLCTALSQSTHSSHCGIRMCLTFSWTMNPLGVGIMLLIHPTYLCQVTAMCKPNDVSKFWLMSQKYLKITVARPAWLSG